MSRLLILTLIFIYFSYSMDLNNVLEDDAYHKLFGDNFEQNLSLEQQIDQVVQVFIQPMPQPHIFDENSHNFQNIHLVQTSSETHESVVNKPYKYQCPWCSYWTLSEIRTPLGHHMASCFGKTSNEEENKKIYQNTVVECERRLDCMRKLIKQVIHSDNSLLVEASSEIVTLYVYKCPWCFFSKISSVGTDLSWHMKECAKKSGIVLDWYKPEHYKIYRDTVDQCHKKSWMFPKNMSREQCEALIIKEKNSK